MICARQRKAKKWRSVHALAAIASNKHGHEDNAQSKEGKVKQASDDDHRSLASMLRPSPLLSLALPTQESTSDSKAYDSGAAPAQRYTPGRIRIRTLLFVCPRPIQDSACVTEPGMPEGLRNGQTRPWVAVRPPPVSSLRPNSRTARASPLEGKVYM